METFSASFQNVRVHLAEIQKQLEHRTTEEEPQPSVPQEAFAPAIAIEQIMVKLLDYQWIAIYIMLKSSKVVLRCYSILCYM